MPESFFERPILNSPYRYPARHWELDESGQPTNQVIETRRRAEFITPIPKPKHQKKGQRSLALDDGSGLSTEEQQYAITAAAINELRYYVDQWRALPNPNQWNVTPETARLLQHWRHFEFNNLRPFFCQIEAVETAIWLTEVAPGTKDGRKFLDHMKAANGRGDEDLLNVIVEVKGYRGEDAKDKKSSMDTYWIPGVNHRGDYGRWRSLS